MTGTDLVVIQPPDLKFTFDLLKQRSCSVYLTNITGLEISLCGNLLHPGMGSGLAVEVFDANRISEMEFKNSAKSIIKNENLVVRVHGKYLSWEKAVPFVLGMSAYEFPFEIEGSMV
ncbi:unnamed protein product [Cuscuta campestris]|uniref:Lipin middle domain-containing protein n=1 Tax=Cuscuta campestris TaxID=132261 RepID=A0A484M194_9ASTE|nr:unnamed protein product [Cuscuta campestris]